VRVVEGVGRAPGERFAFVIFRTQAGEHQSNSRRTLFDCRIGSVDNRDRPSRSCPKGNRLNRGPFVWRCLIVEDLAIGPSFFCWPWRHQLDRTLEFRFVCSLGSGNRSARVRGLNVDNRDVGVGLGGFQNDHVFSGGDRPFGRNFEACATRGYAWTVGRDFRRRAQLLSRVRASRTSRRSRKGSEESKNQENGREQATERGFRNPHGITSTGPWRGTNDTAAGPACIGV